MTGVIEFALLGIGIAAVYVLLAQGLVVIYRGSGVLNFAQGAYAMSGAYLFARLHFLGPWSFAPAFVVSVVVVAVFGALTHLLIMRRLRRASPLARLLATLGVVGVLQGVATLRFGNDLIEVPSSLPQAPIRFGSFIVSEDRLWLMGIACLVTLVLYLLSRYTTVGVATSAVAQNGRAASALGWSPDLVATLTWSLGAALAGVAGILVVPLTGLDQTSLTLTGRFYVISVDPRGGTCHWRDSVGIRSLRPHNRRGRCSAVLGHNGSTDSAGEGTSGAGLYTGAIAFCR
jgi:sulfate-transporting ATPase